jgi:hypothetical protein
MSGKEATKNKKITKINSMNSNLFVEMVNIWHNSRMTQTTATMLSQKLNEKEMRELIEWFKYDNRDISDKLARGDRF